MQKDATRQDHASSGALSSGAAWMKGKIIPISEAAIPVHDWGLTHSDITYDVAPVKDGAFFRLDDYLERFFASMDALHLDPKMTKQEIKDALAAMVAASGLRASYVAMVCSRGVPRVPGSRDPRDCENHFYAWCVPYVHVIKPDVLAKGASALIANDVSRINDTSINPIVKNYHWGDFTKGIFEAKDKGYETVILADADGFITEGPGFNVFAIKDGVVMTSGHGALRGITRKTVLEISDALSFKTYVGKIAKDDFLDADEIFISTSGGGIFPIVKVNNTVFNNGVCGQYTESIRDMYWQWFAQDQYRTVIDYSADASQE